MTSRQFGRPPHIAPSLSLYLASHFRSLCRRAGPRLGKFVLLLPRAVEACQIDAILSGHNDRLHPRSSNLGR